MSKKLSTGIPMFRLSIAIMTIMMSSQLFTQEKKEVETRPFKIIVNKTSETVVKLTCEVGCTWRELILTLENNLPIPIDQFGTSSLTETRTNQGYNDPRLSSFLITIENNQNEINLIGIEGVSWKELRFELSKGKIRAFDTSGETSP